MWFGHILYTLPLHHDSLIKHQHSAFVFYCFKMLSLILLPGSIKLPNTQHKVVWHWRFSTALWCFCHVLTAVSCQVGLPPHRALQEAGSQSSCHGSTGGTEALVAPWRMTSAPSPFTLAYHKPTDRRLHPPTLEDHSHTAKQSQQKVFQYSENHSERPAKHAYIRQYKKPHSHSPAYSFISSSSLFLCPLHPHIPAYTVLLRSSMVYMLSSSKSRHMAERQTKTIAEVWCKKTANTAVFRCVSICGSEPSWSII